MTVPQMAKVIGVTERQIYKYEKLEQKPRREPLHRYRAISKGIVTGADWDECDSAALKKAIRKINKTKEATAPP